MTASRSVLSQEPAVILIIDEDPVILTGIAGNICVLFTANDAYMRDLKIFAPADCIVSNTAADNDHALRQIAVVLKGNVTTSTALRFHGKWRGEKAAAA